MTSLATTKTAAAAAIFTRSIIILLDRMVISSNVKHFYSKLDHGEIRGRKESTGAILNAGEILA